MRATMMFELLGLAVVALVLGAVAVVVGTDTLLGAVLAAGGLLVAVLGAVAVGRRHR